VTKWLLGLFGFDDAAKTLANADDWTIGSMIVTAFNKVKDWVVDLFSWGEKKEGTASKGFSLAKILGDTVNKIWEWFKGLLDIDIMAIAKSIPGAETLLKWMKDDTPEEAVKEYGQTLKAAEKSNLYDSNWRGDSTINREALQKGVTSGVVQKDMLNAILADKDMSDEDTAFIQDLLKPKRKSAGIRPLAEGETIRGRIKENRKERKPAAAEELTRGQGHIWSSRYISNYLKDIKDLEVSKKGGMFGSGDMKRLEDLRKKVTELQRQNQAVAARGNVAVNAPTTISNTKYSQYPVYKTQPGPLVLEIASATY
jgi:hypothetical protein